MANPHKGEVSLSVGDEIVLLSYSVNAMAEMEDELGMGVNEISALMQDATKFRMSMLRAVFWAGLLDHRPGVTLPEAGALLSGLSAIETIRAVTRAFAMAFGTTSEGSDREAARPPTPGGPADGTGPVS